MRVRKKRFAVTLLLLMLVMNCGVTAAQAQETDGFVGIQPAWANVNSFSVGLSFDGGKGMLSGYVLAATGTTSITGSAVLERENANGTYTQVATWSNLSAAGSSLVFNEIYYVSTGYTYRLTFTATAYKGGVGETVSGSKSAFAG